MITSMEPRIIVANTFWKRMIGLLGKRSLPTNTWLAFTPCKQVHTFFMCFTIDVVFLDKENNVLGIETLEPWSVSSYYPTANAAMEMNVGEYTKHIRQKN